MDGGTIEVWSERRDSHLTIKAIESDFVEYPSLDLSVAVTNEDFCEARGGGLVGLNEYEAFVVALRQCERTRRGRATLSGMSPDELEVIVESTDSLGHFQLNYRLGRTSYNSRMIRFVTAIGGFDLDAEFSPQTVADFADLLPVRGFRKD